MIGALAAAAILAALGTGGVASAATATITASAEPADPLFGESFTYRAQATVAADEAAGADVVVGTGPFTRVAPTRVERSEKNGVVTITVTETLACVAAGCLPARDGTEVRLPPARLTGAAPTEAEPVTVTVRPRVPGAAITATKPGFVRPVELPAATTRFDPAVLQAALVLVGIVLVGAGAYLVVSPFRRRRSAAAGGATDVDQVARAARLLRESTTRTTTDRRRAAALAARVAGESQLTADAAQVAWSRAAPEAPDAATLADRIEETREAAPAGHA